MLLIVVGQKEHGGASPIRKSMWLAILKLKWGNEVNEQCVILCCTYLTFKSYLMKGKLVTMKIRKLINIHQQNPQLQE